MLQPEKSDGVKDKEKIYKKAKSSRQEGKLDRDRAELSPKKICKIHMRVGHTTQECFQNPLKKKLNVALN